MFIQIAMSILIIGISIAILNWASNLTISNACKIADITQLGKTIVGFSLVGFLTNLPELSVALIAALSGGAAISVGNVIGANIAIVCVILGLAPLVLYLKLRRKTVAFKDSGESNECNVVPCFAKPEISSIRFGLIVSSIVPIVLLFATSVTWLLGLVLILIFVIYTYRLSRVRVPSKSCDFASSEEKRQLKRYLLLTIVGALGVVGSAYFLVESAVFIAQSVGVAQAVIGATVIAFGTSLPELVLDMKLFLKGHSALALGDIAGSSFVNITVVLGVAFFVSALVGSPIQIDTSVLVDLAFFSIVANLFFAYFLYKRRIHLKEGIIFLTVYALFLIITLIRF
jgi:cation:H+ antiporter